MTGYNGWVNWATWNAALWMDNDEFIYKRRMIRKPGTATEAERLFREYFPAGTPDMDDPIKDMAQVDWDEIAESWRAEYAEE